MADTSFAGSCRFVFNQALALQNERDEQGDRSVLRKQKATARSG
ncbi:helix-turn-helix domain-containing protein [Cupriavidus sp. IDO]